ncbi:MAG: 30S ribosomal protein S11 [Patescibacteria group bacterium]
MANEATTTEKNPISAGPETTTEAGKQKKNKILRQIAHGRAYIQATYNNTIVTLTDLNGNVLSWSSAGQNNFKGPKKSTPYAASVIVKNAIDKAKAYGLKNVNVYVKGVGTGREAAVRALNTYGLNVLTINDVTPIPHNGCRHRKPRRV